jgi:hypothetical protein
MDTDGVSWVIPGDFDPDKLSIQAAASRSPGDTYERGKLMYEYTPGAPKRDLVVTVPRAPEAYLTCRGVSKDMFTRGDTRVETNRYGAQLVLSGSNDHHKALYKLFEDVVSKVEEMTGTSVVFPNKDMENYSILYTNLIHSNDGTMYSKAYTDGSYLDILDCGKCLVRPALLLSTLKRSATETKIRVQISQMYVHESIASFPLATND